MIPFCVDARVIGTERHLVCTDRGYVWSERVPDEMYHLSGAVKPLNDWCLDSMLKLSRLSLDLSPPDRFVAAMRSVVPGGDVSSVPWRYVMPSWAHRDFVKNIVQRTIELLPKLPVEYFRETWASGNSTLRSLVPASIDPVLFAELIDARVGNVNAVRTFRPDECGSAAVPRYDRFGTLTGRLTMASGPSILTLKKEYRRLIVPSAPGAIVMIDFASLEPRIILHEAGRECNDVDMYATFAAEIGCDRRTMKGAIIAELYGMSRETLSSVLGVDKEELSVFITKVRRRFRTLELLRRIKQGFYDAGRIENRYGRPVFIDEPSDRVFVNNYAQSTGADVALLGFDRIIKRLALEAPQVRPLFVLHDALLLDVPERYVGNVMSIDYVFVPGYEQRYRLKAELLACTRSHLDVR